MKLRKAIEFADVYLVRGEIDHAAVHIDKANTIYLAPDRKTHPVKGWILRTMGDVLMALGKVSEAKESYQVAADIFRVKCIDVGSAICLMKLGYAELRYGSINEACILLDQAVAAIRKSPSACYALAEVLLARIEVGKSAQHSIRRYGHQGGEDMVNVSKVVDDLTRIDYEFQKLENDPDLQTLWAQYSLVKAHFDLEIGVADSVAFENDFHPLDTIDYAAENDFDLVQTYL